VKLHQAKLKLSQSLIHQVSVSDAKKRLPNGIILSASQSLIHQVSVSDFTNRVDDPFPGNGKSQSLIHQVSVSDGLILILLILTS